MLGQAGAGGGGLPGGGDEERAEQPGGFLAEDALGQPGQQQAAGVEHRAHGEGGRAGGDRGADERAEQERAELVEQRPGRLRPRCLGQLLIPGPEPGQHRVGDRGGDPPPVGVRAEQGGDVGQGDLPGPGRDGAQQGEDRGAEDVVGARPPERGVDAAEDPGDVVGDHVGVAAVGGALQHVEAGRRAAGGRVEQHHLPDGGFAGGGGAGR